MSYNRLGNFVNTHTHKKFFFPSFIIILLSSCFGLSFHSQGVLLWLLSLGIFRSQVCLIKTYPRCNASVESQSEVSFCHEEIGQRPLSLQGTHTTGAQLRGKLKVVHSPSALSKLSTETRRSVKSDNCEF